ncbi:porin [Variovorax paradoxus]|jgi:predicted porin|uniref:Porin n=1 Tax=Variovorax paradoxus TaxID=34073 RepID=A0A5Q0LXK6_VARPD|nr:porin [Variovorax paradoxus]QFZ81909.1 porin [Variovorax paradoxus]
MKKSFVMIAAMVGAGFSSAQSTITMFGVVDVGVSNYSSKSQDENSGTLANPFYLNQGTRTVNRMALSNGNYSSSRLGFRGSEDLGGGLAASFWLESSISPDDGATGVSSFQRRSTVSLSGPFGEVRLGRDYVPTAWNDIIFDPFGIVGVGRSLIFTALNTNTAAGSGGFGGDPNYNRASNSVGYFLPSTLGGFYGQAMYAINENNKYDPGTATPPGVSPSGATNPGPVATVRAGRYFGGRVGYKSGPLDVAFSYGNSTAGDSYYAGTTNSVKTMNLGASYDFGPAKLFGELSRSKSTRDYAVVPVLGGIPDVDQTGYLLGVTVPVGPGMIRAAYSQVKYDLNTPFSVARDPKANKLAIGYVHNLSKRTALYATVARISNKNGAALTVGGPAFFNDSTFTPKTSTGYDFGLRHSF